MTRRAFLGASAAAVGALAVAPAAAAESKKKLVLLAGKPSHGPMEHEFNAGVLLLAKCLANAPGLEVVHYKGGWPDSEKAFEGASGIFLYADGGNGHPFLQANHLAIVGDFMKRGVGLMCAHYAVEVPRDKAGKEFQDWIGGYYEHLWSCNPMWSPNFTDLPRHEITRGVKPFTIRDEWYFNIRFAPESKKVTPILVATPPDDKRGTPAAKEHLGREEIVAWTFEREKGRSFGFTGGHFHKNWGDENFRRLVVNAILWSANVEVPKEGAKVEMDPADLKKNLDRKGK
jgi:type 1 glutamine amidotransferase